MTNASQSSTSDSLEITQLLIEAKRIARRFYQLTGKPLGISGEVAEYEAARLLGLKLAPAREAAIDGFLDVDGSTKTIQIKGRAVDAKRRYVGRVSKIKLLPTFDAAVLVLLNKEDYETLEIWWATYDDIRMRLIAPGSKSRNDRGSMGISQFKSIAKKVWLTVEENSPMV
jgi:hypothetical protein